MESCAAAGVRLGLLNARMSSRAFLGWFQNLMSRALLARMLRHFSLIVPQSDIVSGRRLASVPLAALTAAAALVAAAAAFIHVIQSIQPLSNADTPPARRLMAAAFPRSRWTALSCWWRQDVGRFRILGATLGQMPGWCSDLKYAAALGNSVWHLWRPKPGRIAALRAVLSARTVWVAAHTQHGEEAAAATVHVQLAKVRAHVCARAQTCSMRWWRRWPHVLV